MAPKGKRMSLAELDEKFGGDLKQQALPTASEGREYGKGIGKGGGGFQDSYEREFRGKGKGRGKDEPSRADTEDWFRKDDGGSGFDRRGSTGGFGGGRRQEPASRADGEDDWRRAPRGGDRDDGPRGGPGLDRRGSRCGGDDNREWRRGEEPSGPSERPRLNLKPRSSDLGAPGGAAQSIRDQMNKRDDEPASDGPRKYQPPRGSIRESRPDREEEAPRQKGTGYLPPHKRKQMEEEAAAERTRSDEEARRRVLEEGLDRRRQVADKAEGRDRQAAVKLEEERKEKERLEKLAKKRAKDEAKKDAKAKSIENPEKPTKVEATKDAKLDKFAQNCAAAVKDGKGDVKAIVKDLKSLVPASELETVGPVQALFAPLLEFCREKDDQLVVDTVKKFAPLMKKLVEEADQWRFKVKLLMEVMNVAIEMGLPRLSPKSALLEVVFDGLYCAEVIEEQYFTYWSQHEDTNIQAVFQVRPFLDFLSEARIQGEDYDDDMEWISRQGKFVTEDCDDLHVGYMTLEAAKRKAMDLGKECKGFFFAGDPESGDLLEVTFKGRESWDLMDDEDYYTFAKDENDDDGSSSSGSDRE